MTRQKFLASYSPTGPYCMELYEGRFTIEPRSGEIFNAKLASQKFGTGACRNVADKSGICFGDQIALYWIEEALKSYSDAFDFRHFIQGFYSRGKENLLEHFAWSLVIILNSFCLNQASLEFSTSM